MASAPDESPLNLMQVDSEAAEYIAVMEKRIMGLTTLVDRYRAVMQAAWNGVGYEELEEFLAWREQQQEEAEALDEDQLTIDDVEQ